MLVEKKKKKNAHETHKIRNARKASKKEGM